MKSKQSKHAMVLALSAGLIAIVQSGCQIPSASVQSANNLAMRYNPSPVSVKITDLPTSNHFSAFQQPAQSQRNSHFGGASGTDTQRATTAIRNGGLGPVSYKFTDFIMDADIVPDGNIVQASWEAPIVAQNQPIPQANSPLRGSVQFTGGMVSDEAITNHSGPLNIRALSSGWEEAFAKGRKLERKNDLMGAAAIYESLVSQGFQQPEIFHRLAVCYDQTDRAHLSLPLYEKALELDPQNPDILCDLGYRLQLIGNTRAAERFYNLALHCNNRHTRTNNHLGVLLAQDNRKDEALRHFRAGGLNIWQAKHNVNASIHNMEIGADSLQ